MARFTKVYQTNEYTSMMLNMIHRQIGGSGFKQKSMDGDVVYKKGV